MSQNATFLATTICAFTNRPFTQCSVLNKLTLYLKQKKVKKHGKVQ